MSIKSILSYYYSWEQGNIIYNFNFLCNVNAGIWMLNMLSVLIMSPYWDTELSVLTPVNLLYMSSSRGWVWWITPQQAWSDPWVRARRRRQEGPNRRRSSSTKWRLLSEEKEGIVRINYCLFLHTLYSIVLWVSIF